MTLEPQQVLFIAVGFLTAVVLFYIVQVGKRMKDLLAVKVKRMVLGVILFLVALVVCRDLGLTPTESLAIAVCAELSPVWLVRSRRSRYVPVHVKKAVLRRDLRGEEFDSKRITSTTSCPIRKAGIPRLETFACCPRKLI